MIEDKHIYSTNNLFLAATISLYFPIESINYINPRQAEFEFLHSPELTNLINAYWKGDLRLEPKLLLSQLKVVKSRLYEGGTYDKR